MGGEKLWKILCTSVGNFRILVLFPSFNAYEMVDEFETFCEKPVAPQPSLHVRDETMKRSFFVSLPSTKFTNLIPSCHYVEIFLFQFVSFDAYKTIKAIEFFCIKAFAYSE